MISQRTKEVVAGNLGLSVSDLTDQFYRVVNEDLTTRDGFTHKLGVEAVDPKWNPDPSIDCGEGLHVVWGHPFLVLAFCIRNNPRFFKLPEGTTRVLVPSHDSDGKFRTEAITLLAENELGEDAPEFDQGVLLKIAKSDYSYRVRMAAVDKITDRKVLTYIAKNDYSWQVQVAASLRLRSL